MKEGFHQEEKQPIVWGIDTSFTELQIVGCMLCDAVTVDVPRNLKKHWYANGIIMYRGKSVNVKFALCPKHNTIENQMKGWEWAKEGLLAER